VRWVQITHPFHPLAGQQFVFLTQRKNWGEDRVSYQDAAGHPHSVPTGWTDLVMPDPFVSIAAGRALFRPADLLRVVALIKAIQR
jgi:hypothetical protein